MERDDTGIKLYTFGMNDQNGRLIEFKIPSPDQHEAVRTLKQLLGRRVDLAHPDNYFWLNDEKDYR